MRCGWVGNSMGDMFVDGGSGIWGHGRGQVQVEGLVCPVHTRGSIW